MSSAGRAKQVAASGPSPNTAAKNAKGLIANKVSKPSTGTVGKGNVVAAAVAATASASAGVTTPKKSSQGRVAVTQATAKRHKHTNKANATADGIGEQSISSKRFRYMNRLAGIQVTNARTYPLQRQFLASAVRNLANVLCNILDYVQRKTVTRNDVNYAITSLGGRRIYGEQDKSLGTGRKGTHTKQKKALPTPNNKNKA